MSESGCNTCPTNSCIHTDECWDAIPNLFNLFNIEWNETFNEWAVQTFGNVGDVRPGSLNWKGGYLGPFDPYFSRNDYLRILEVLAGEERTEDEQALLYGIEHEVFSSVSEQGRLAGEDDDTWIRRIAAEPLRDGYL